MKIGGKMGFCLLGFMLAGVSSEHADFRFCNLLL